MKSKEEIEYDERVKRRVLILKDLIVEGRIQFAESMRESLEDSFSKARYDKNGEPNLATIDGTIRSMALMAEHINHRDKMKSAISLVEIQKRYFDFVEANFITFYEMMIKNNATPNAIASFVAYGEEDIDFIDEPIQKMISELEKFWEVVAESGYLHLEDDYDSIKAVFGGDLFPAHDENIASKCGIYTDTIILPCPFIRSRHMFKVWDKQQRVYFLIKHALNILQYKELALIEFDNPIVVILPDKEMMDESSHEEVQRLGEIDALYHAKKVFGRDFESIEELVDFGEQLDSIDKVLNELKEPDKVLFDIDLKDPLKIQIEKQIEGEAKQLMGTNHPGLIVSTLGLGRMGVCNEILMKSAKVGGIPLIDAPTSWEYFKWKLQYDSERTHPEKDYSKLHVVKGLNGLNNTSLNWIGKIPPKGLIELRKIGAINEIRAILSKGIDEIVAANEMDFTKTSHKVFNNLNFAFNQHQENIQKLINKKWKIAGKDFGSWIVMGTVEIAAACLGTPLFGASAFAIDQILDAPKIKDLPKTVDEMKAIEKKKEDLKKSPLGLMFKYKK